jgi:hypothetical protein
MAKKKPPKDENIAAFELMKKATEKPAPEEPSQDDISRIMAAMGRRGGLKGGPARAKKLSEAKRKEIARKAAQTRWAKKSSQ